MDESTRLIDFFNEYASFLDEMKAVQKEKLDSLLSNDLQRMERSIKSQQAYAMRFDNIENRRIRLQTEAGLGGKTFSELIEFAPADEKQALRSVFERVQNAISEIKYLNGKAIEVADLNIRRAGSPASRNIQGYETGQGSAHSASRMDTKV